MDDNRIDKAWNKESEDQEVYITMNAHERAKNEVNIFFCCEEDHKKCLKVKQDC